MFIDHENNKYTIMLRQMMTFNPVKKSLYGIINVFKLFKHICIASHTLIQIIMEIKTSEVQKQNQID